MKEDVPCQLCGGFDSDGHFFGCVLFSPLVRFREGPEFAGLTAPNKE